MAPCKLTICCETGHHNAEELPVPSREQAEGVASMIRKTCPLCGKPLVVTITEDAKTD